MSKRFEYVAYDEESKKLQDCAKIAVTAVEGCLSGLPEGRAKSLALTKLEECYMWIGKAIRDKQCQTT